MLRDQGLASTGGRKARDANTPATRGVGAHAPQPPPRRGRMGRSRRPRQVCPSMNVHIGTDVSATDRYIEIHRSIGGTGCRGRPCQVTATLIPPLSTLNPHAYALKPLPSSFIPQPSSTLNPQPSTLNAHSYALKPLTPRHLTPPPPNPEHRRRRRPRQVAARAHARMGLARASRHHRRHLGALASLSAARRPEDAAARAS